MKVSGATFVRNAIKFDYPVRESILSVLPLCDEFIVNVGESEDATLDLIRSISSLKIRIMRSTWDDRLRTGGLVLSEQTNAALKHCAGDWVFYIQADEVLHERYLEPVRKQMLRYLNVAEVAGLLFDFRHFYGSYFLVKDERGWYRREIRVIRNNVGISSWKDAQGFRLGGRKLRVVPAHAEVYHYGWARDPAVMIAKQRNLDRYWHSDRWIENRYRRGLQIQMRGVVPFMNTHPGVMDERISKADWDVFADPARRKQIKRSLSRQLLSIFDSIGEYKNYVLLNEARIHAGTR